MFPRKLKVEHIIYLIGFINVLILVHEFLVYQIISYVSLFRFFFKPFGMFFLQTTDLHRQ